MQQSETHDHKGSDGIAGRDAPNPTDRDADPSRDVTDDEHGGNSDGHAPTRGLAYQLWDADPDELEGSP